MAFAEALAARVRGILSPVAGWSEKKMFGGLCFLIRGNMCGGVLKDEPVFRVAPERAEALLRRTLKGFVFIETGALGTARQVSAWVAMALAFAQSLPRKRFTRAQLRGLRVQRALRR